MALKMTSAQVVETLVNVNNNSSLQNYNNPDDHIRHTTDTPGFKPFTISKISNKNRSRGARAANPVSYSMGLQGISIATPSGLCGRNPFIFTSTVERETVWSKETTRR